MKTFYERVERAGVHFTRFDQDDPEGGLQSAVITGACKGNIHDHSHR